MYYTDDDPYFDKQFEEIVKSRQGFENFKEKNPAYLNTLNNKITELYTLYTYLHNRNFYKIEKDPEFYETACLFGYGLLMRHALEVISIDVCMSNNMDIGGKSVFERLCLLHGQTLPNYDSRTESVLAFVLDATNTVAHPHITKSGVSLASLQNFYSTQFSEIIETQIAQTNRKTVKKYLKQVKKELDTYDIRKTYPCQLATGCSVRQLTECIVNLWCFNQTLLPTDATIDGEYITIRSALINLQYLAENSTRTAFGMSSLTTEVVDTLFALKNTSNAFMHVDPADMKFSNIKKFNGELRALHPKVRTECSPCALEMAFDSSKRDTPPLVTTILCGLFGWVGAHHFYAKNIFKGIFFLLTFGCFFVGPLFNLNQLRKGTFVSKKWGTLNQTRWSTVASYAFMALHIFLLYLLLFKSK